MYEFSDMSVTFIQYFSWNFGRNVKTSTLWFRQDHYKQQLFEASRVISTKQTETVNTWNFWTILRLIFLQIMILTPMFCGTLAWDFPNLETSSCKQLGKSETMLRRLWNPFGAGRKFFDHPTPKRSILGVQNFLPSLFRPFLFKKNFGTIFSVSKESYLERTDACWGVNLFQKCLIIRSKGPGSLWIEFGDRLLKLEKWSNSSNFVKLTVNRYGCFVSCNTTLIT